MSSSDHCSSLRAIDKKATIAVFARDRSLKRLTFLQEFSMLAGASRASFEMVQKTARAGFPMMAAISAPTAPAVQVADRAGLTLAGFVRGGRHVIYTHAQRLAPQVGEAGGVNAV